MTDMATVLNRVPLFGDLNQRQLKRLARLCKEVPFPAGATVVQQGQMSGIGFFVIADGTAIVTVDGTEVARVGPGDHFGEMAVITEGVRTATVTAETPLRCLVISLWDFRGFAKDNPDVSWKLLQHLAALLEQQRDRRPGATPLPG